MNKHISSNRKFLIDRLGIMRARAGLSARELSAQIGKSKAYIAKFDNGDLAMPSEVLLEAVECCGTTPEEFFYKDLQNYKHDKEILDAFKTLSQDSKQTIIDLMKKLK